MFGLVCIIIWLSMLFWSRRHMAICLETHDIDVQVMQNYSLEKNFYIRFCALTCMMQDEILILESPRKMEVLKNLRCECHECLYEFIYNKDRGI